MDRALSLPASYAALETQHIAISHVPKESPTPTPVVVVTLDRPENNNAWTGLMADELQHVFTLFNLDDRVRAIVITGAGRMFCAGMDLDIRYGNKNKEAEAKPPLRDIRDRWAKLIHSESLSTMLTPSSSGGRVTVAIHNCRKPTIVAINGHAVGIGITLTLPATIRVAYKNAKIGFVFARRGIILEAASSFFLPRIVGHGRALHLNTTGAVYPASHPLLSTLFSEVLDTPEATVARALELATEIAENTSMLSTSLIRELMYRGPDTAEATHLLDSKINAGLMDGSDNKEGVRSFLEKRKPAFTGSFQNDEVVPEGYPWWVPVDVKPSPKAGGKAKL